MKAADFALTPDEEQYLSDQIAAATEGSMLAWLVRNPPSNRPDFVWEVDNLHQAPQQLRDLADHARRFSITIHGAALVYNLLLARKGDRSDLVDEYEDRIDRWTNEVLIPSGALEGWSRTDWWATIQRKNPRLRAADHVVVNRWLDLLESGAPLSSSKPAADLVATRERQIKGGRARLVNQSALDRWSGGSGLAGMSSVGASPSDTSRTSTPRGPRRDADTRDARHADRRAAPASGISRRCGRWHHLLPEPHCTAPGPAFLRTL